jgi:hypothetical protein
MMGKQHDLMVMSFGGGVQSTAMLLLCKHKPELVIAAMGRLPDLAIFADTGAETALVHDHIKRLKASGLPFPLEVVSSGNISELQDLNRVPFFTKGANGSTGMLRRQCTEYFKIKPIELFLRSTLGYRKGQRIPPGAVGLWIGISTDEASRMRDNQSPWITNLYPLINLGWARSKCISFAQEHGISSPKSRCFFCPYVSDWARVAKEEPDEFARAVAHDKAIRSRFPTLRDPAFVHRRCIPLDEAVEIDKHEKHNQLDMFEQDCTGHCGV